MKQLVLLNKMTVDRHGKPAWFPGTEHRVRSPILTCRTLKANAIRISRTEFTFVAGSTLVRVPRGADRLSRPGPSKTSPGSVGP